MSRSKISKGFAYTSFSLLSASILLTIVFAQVYQPGGIQNSNAERIGEASFFIDSALSDTDRSLRIASRRALTGATNYVIEEGEGLSNAEENVSEIMVNGTLDGEEVETVGNASLNEWADRVSRIAARSGYELDISVADYSLQTSGFESETSFNVKVQLFDPTTLASFNRTDESRTRVPVTGLEDPLLTLRSKGRYTTVIEKCGFKDPAEQLYTASQNSSSVFHGEAIKNPSDGESVEDQSRKVLVTEDIESYSTNYTSDFDGIVAAQEAGNPSNYNSDYALGTGSVDGLNDGSGVTVDSAEVWRTGFVQMFDGGCYVPSERGPAFFSRLENDISSDNRGFATLIDVSELPSELQKTDSAVGFVYFNDSSPNLNRIKGVSDEYTWFRLDDYHVQQWGVEGLVE